MDLMEKVVSLAKRRGFIYPGSEIYGGLANTYDFGPLGAMLKKNISDLWWNFFVAKRENIYPIESSILMSPKVWEASGHTQSFTNVLIDCKECNFRTRADHLIEDNLDKYVEGLSLLELDKIIEKNKLKCPKCGKTDWTKSRNFNQLFETQVGIITEGKSTVYLRGENAQGMFVNFTNILDSIHPRIPFGLAQIGKAFRNEITMGKFTFRTLEFDLAEFEYFIKEADWEKDFEYWKGEMEKWVDLLGLTKDQYRWREHTKDELSHYSKKTEDLEYKFPWGYKEMYGLAYRTDYDLKNHMEKSGVDLRYTDFQTGEKFIPHVVEPTFGISRTLTIILMNSYWEDEEKKRVVLKLPVSLAPYKVAVFPLLKNKEELVKNAREIYKTLKENLNGSVVWDDRGNIGKRYFAQDEIGTPWCVTADFDSLEDNKVTVRDRDTASQERIAIDKLTEYFQNKLR
jgi:glycyl-tRNA synthetase